jgi:multisubunit Na+/H+ antiporter MnhE subunit
MMDLKTAMTVVGIVVGVAVVVVMGDLLGNIFGRARLAIIMGAISLIAIVAFVIYVAVLLAVFK